MAHVAQDLATFHLQVGCKGQVLGVLSWERVNPDRLIRLWRIVEVRGRDHAALPAWVPDFLSAVALLDKRHESKGSILSRTGFLIQ